LFWMYRRKIFLRVWNLI
jgi:hypothetical protein